MNKDAILASVIGFGIGLLITGGILLGPTAISQLANRLQSREGEVASATNQQTTTTPGVAQPQEKITLTIESPKAESIVHEDTLVIKGKTQAGAVVILAGDLDEVVVKTDSSGSFSGQISLKEGKNDVTVTAINNSLSNLQKTIIFYTP
jgi:hypothetical protein